MAVIGDMTSWSEPLKNQTRESINEMWVAPDGFLHFKHKVYGHGAIAAMDLARKVVAIKSGERYYYFQDVDQLLLGGWVID